MAILHQIMKKYTILFLALFLTACGTKAPESKPITPTPPPTGELSNAQLRADLTAYLQANNHPRSTSYDISRIELNNDNNRDALVFLNTPYGYWCEKNGCTMLVFKAGREQFRPITLTSPIRGPIYVSRTKTKGWNDIIMRVSGRREDAKNVVLKFNGQSYPENPEPLRASNILPALMPGYTLVYAR